MASALTQTSERELGYERRREGVLCLVCACLNRGTGLRSRGTGRVARRASSFFRQVGFLLREGCSTRMSIATAKVSPIGGVGTFVDAHRAIHGRTLGCKRVQRRTIGTLGVVGLEWQRSRQTKRKPSLSL